MQIHRFRDAAAIALAGPGETRYMTAAEADKAADALRAVAESIRRERFSASPSLTVAFTTYAEPSQVPPQAFAIERELADVNERLAESSDAKRPGWERLKRELESTLETARAAEGER